MIHAVFAAAMTLMLGMTLGQWIVGAVFAAAFYMGREHAQAEHRWIEIYGGGRRANMPWYGGFDPKVWNLKSVTDFAAPALILALGVLIGG